MIADRFRLLVASLGLTAVKRMDYVLQRAFHERSKCDVYQCVDSICQFSRRQPDIGGCHGSTLLGMELATLQSVLESYPGLAIISDPAAKLIYVNNVSHSLIDAACSTGSSDLRLISTFAKEFEQHHQRLRSDGSENCEILLAIPGKPEKLQQIISYQQLLADGREVYVSQLPGDTCLRISDAIQTFEKTDAGLLDRRNRTLLAISEVTERMLMHQPLDELLKMVARHLMDLSGASATFVHLVRPAEDHLELVVAVGEFIAPIGHQLKRGEGLAGVAWDTATSAYVDDYNQLPARLKQISNVKQACALPMITSGTVQGVLGLMFTDESESIADRLDLLQQFTNLTNIAMHNAMMIEDTRIELSQTQSLTEFAKKITSSESIPKLFDVAAHSMIDNYGIDSVDAWEIKNGRIDSAICAWERCDSGISKMSIDQQNESQEELVHWLDSNPVLLDSLPTVGGSSLSFFELTPFSKDGYSTIALLDHGEFWGLLRLQCSGSVLPLSRTQHLLFSIFGHLSTSARLLRMLSQANFRAGHDQLTGLPNRYAFYQWLEQQLSEAVVGSQRMAVFFVDLDGFKHVNDTFGHAQGDKLLIEVAKRFESVLEGEYLLARLGGDEFIVALRGAGRPICAAIAQSLLDTLEAKFDLPQNLAVGASIGIALCPIDGTGAEELVNKADEAMYEAKLSGKHQFCFFKKSFKDESAFAEDSEDSLRKAS